jgi:hypothetical protein
VSESDVHIDIAAINGFRVWSADVVDRLGEVERLRAHVAAVGGMLRTAIALAEASEAPDRVTRLALSGAVYVTARVLDLDTQEAK